MTVSHSLKTALPAAVSLLALSASGALAQTAYVATEGVEEIHVLAARRDMAGTSVAIPHEPTFAPAPDAAAYLMNLPGVAASRMAGHALEPVIRGQMMNRLNIISDGAYVFGAGPNRMDPPTSHVAFESMGLITVERGYQSVQNGPGGPGGTVRFDRIAPTFDAANPYDARVGTFWESNGDVFGVNGLLAAGVGNGYARVTGSYKEAENYEDGNGVDVASSYQVLTVGGELGWTFAGGTELMATVDYDRAEDVLFPGAAMDSPLTEGLTYRLKGEVPLSANGPWQRVRFTLYGTQTDHTMNNFDLRPRTMMFREAILSNNTYGGHLAVDADFGAMALSLGGDLISVHHDGRRYGNDMNPEMVTLVQSVLLPDVSITQAGLFAEGQWTIDADRRLKVGVRYDHVSASADDTDDVTDMAPMMMAARAPDALYARWYGVTADKRTENNVGGLIRYEQDITDAATVYLGVSRVVRTADPVERFMASDMGNMGMMGMTSWVGNPGLKPEKHHQVDAGVSYRSAELTALASVYYDAVDDYIFRDVARGQAGVLTADGQRVYHNIDARLYGVEAEIHTTVAEVWRIDADAAYTNGQNRDEHIPLPQIPPLSGKLSVAYAHSDQTRIGTRLRWATKQTRVDDNTATGSGLDAGKTPGYAVVDLFAAVGLTEYAQASFGVTNLFDKAYANHLNRENLVDATAVQVNEPGRSVYLRLRLSR